MKHLARTTLLVILGLALSTTAILAQQQQMPPQPEPLSPEEVTDSQLDMLVGVSQAAEGIQMEADQKMRAALENGGMDFSRFQEIMMAQQDPTKAEDIELSEEEQQTLQTIQPELMQINQEARQNYMAAIEEQGFSIQEFQQIAQAVQSHPEVAKRYEAKLSESETDSGNDDM